MFGVIFYTSAAFILGHVISDLMFKKDAPLTKKERAIANSIDGGTLALLAFMLVSIDNIFSISNEQIEIWTKFICMFLIILIGRTARIKYLKKISSAAERN